MKEVTYEVMFTRSAYEVYDALRHIDSWAHLAPNYAFHTHIAQGVSHWTMNGILPSRPIQAEIRFVKEQRPTILAFTLNGLTEDFLAKGQVIITPTASGCSMFVQVRAEATGRSKLLLNPLIHTALPRVTKHLSDKLHHFIEQQ